MPEFDGINIAHQLLSNLTASSSSLTHTSCSPEQEFHHPPTDAMFASKKERETITAAPGGWRRSPSTWPAEIPALPPVDQPLHFFSDWMSVLLTLVTGSGLVMAIINEEDDHSSRCSPEDY